MGLVKRLLGFFRRRKRRKKYLYKPLSGIEKIYWGLFTAEELDKIIKDRKCKKLMAEHFKLEQEVPVPSKNRDKKIESMTEEEREKEKARQGDEDIKFQDKNTKKKGIIANALWERVQKKVLKGKQEYIDEKLAETKIIVTPNNFIQFL